jgi:hypothetical protein
MLRVPVIDLPPMASARYKPTRGARVSGAVEEVSTVSEKLKDRPSPRLSAFSASSALATCVSAKKLQQTKPTLNRTQPEGRYR